MQQGPSPSAAALLFLFADRVVERGGIVTSKVKVPCTDATVKQSALADHLFAIGFWSLQQQDKLDLTMGKRTMLGVGKHQITASLRPGVEVRTPPEGQQVVVDLQQVQLAGGLTGLIQGLAEQAQAAAQEAAKPLESGEKPFTLEEATLHQVQLQGGSAPVRRVIGGWFGSDTQDPHGEVINRVARELNQLGFVTGVDQKSSWSEPEILVDCDRLADLEATATDMLERWRAFLEAPDGLGSTLLERCNDAINSMTESND